MKKGSKIGWIIASIFVTIGICCVIIGIILEGDIKKIKDSFKQEVTRLESVDSDYDDLGDVIEDALPPEFSSSSAEVVVGDEYQFEDDVQTHTFEKCNSLEVEVRYGTLKIQKTDKDLIVVHAQEIAENDFSVRNSGGILSIIDKSVRKEPGKSPVIIIEVPENYRFSETELDLDAGKIEIDYLQADELQAEVGAGTMDVSGKLTANNADLSVGAGQIKVNELDAKMIELGCDAGRIIAKLTGVQKDYAFEGECGAGKIQFGTETYTMFDHDDKQHHSGSRSVEADCGIGSIELNF